MTYPGLFLWSRTIVGRKYNFYLIVPDHSTEIRTNTGQMLQTIETLALRTIDVLVTNFLLVFQLMRRKLDIDMCVQKLLIFYVPSTALFQSWLGWPSFWVLHKMWPSLLSKLQLNRDHCSEHSVKTSSLANGSFHAASCTLVISWSRDCTISLIITVIHGFRYRELRALDEPAKHVAESRRREKALKKLTNLVYLPWILVRWYL